MRYVRVLPVATTKRSRTAEIIRLDHEARRKTRQHVTTVAGREAALLLPRGTVLYHGDRVATANGRIAVIAAADEALSEVRCRDPLLLARAAFHLGNRHAVVMLAPDGIRYPENRALDEMMRSLGLEPTAVVGPFEPEEGAYIPVFDSAIGGVGTPWIP